MTGQAEHNPLVIAAVIQNQLRAKYPNNAPLIAPKFSGPQVDTYTVELGGVLRVEDVERMARTIGSWAGAQSCTVATTATGGIELQIPRPTHARSVLFASQVEAILRAKYGEVMAPSPLAVTLGIDMSGQGVWIDLSDPTYAHILLSGATGTGKSVLGKWVLWCWLMQNPPDKLRWIGADPKKADPKEGLFFFRRSKHLLHPIVDQTQDVVRLLDWVLWEIDRRKATREREPRILVFLEEVSFFADESPLVQERLSSIMKIARGFNITVIATTQKPGVDSLGKALPNFTFTVAGRVARENSAYGATGRARTGAGQLLGRGDMVALYPADVTVRFQAPYADHAQFTRLPNVPKGEALPRLALDDVTPTVTAQMPQRWGGRRARELTTEDMAEARRLIQAGRGANALVQRFGIGTDRARDLARSFASEVAQNRRGN